MDCSEDSVINETSSSAPVVNRQRRTRTRTISVTEDTVDERMISRLLVIHPNTPISYRLMIRHPGGDRHPNPDYEPRAKLTNSAISQIVDGLGNYEKTLKEQGYVAGPADSYQQHKKINTISRDEFNRLASVRISIFICAVKP